MTKPDRRRSQIWSTEEIPENPQHTSAALPLLPIDQGAAIEALESSSKAADLLGAAVIEGLVAVRRYEMTTFGDLPLAETCQALRLAWSC